MARMVLEGLYKAVRASLMKSHKEVCTMARPKKRSFSWHIRKVLAEQKKPMHYADITREILKVKETKGKTPERTVMAVLIRDKKNIFKRVGDGVFCLSTSKEESTKT